MKKILTLAIIAFLVGGFAYNANAQTETKPQTQSSRDQNSNSYEKLVKDYETAVEQCVNCYYEMQKPNSTVKTSNFTKLLAKAESLKKQVEGVKDQLNRTLASRVNKATSKLSVVYQKG